MFDDTEKTVTELIAKWRERAEHYSDKGVTNTLEGRADVGDGQLVAAGIFSHCARILAEVLLDGRPVADCYREDSAEVRS